MNTSLIDLSRFLDLIDTVLGPVQVTKPCCCTKPAAYRAQDPKFNALPKTANGGFYCPPVERVIFNGNATIVTFKDGTKSIVVKEPNDPYDRTTAIAYAIAKRTLATAYDCKNYAVNAAYINTIRSLIENGYDQEAEAEKAAKQERQAKAEHEARQAKQSAEAFERKARARAEELRLEARAKEILAEDSLKKTKKPLNEVNTSGLLHSGLLQVDPADAWKLYRRPDKPFSQFTDEEKKAYWKYHNAKRRASK